MLLTIQNLTKIFTDQNNNHIALNKINLKIDSGDFISIIGKSGTGKSTFLHLLAGLTPPSSGKIHFNHQDINTFSDHQASTYRNKNVGMVFQDFHLLNHLTMKDNIQLPIKLYQKKLNAKQQKHYELLIKQTELENLDHRFPKQLSGGQRQRVAICRALINSPNLVLADEPTGNLDLQTGETIINTLIQLHKKHRFTLIIVTHDQELARRANQTFELKNGLLHPIN